MAEKAARISILLRSYHRYLNDVDTARFIASIASHYSVGTLHRLVLCGDTYSRRAAALALGLISDTRSNPVLGPLLRCQDRKLRLVVDDALRAIWSREGSDGERQQLELIVRANECGHFERSVELANQLVDACFAGAEAFHQRSLALYQLGQVDLAIEDCRRTLKLNGFHYAAMVGLGHCYLELGNLIESLFWFRQALDIYPDLEPVRVQICKLEKAIQEL